MTAFRHRLSALALIAIATTVVAYGQEQRGRGRRGRNVVPPRQKAEPSGPEEKVIQRAPRPPVPQMPNAQVAILSLKHANPWEVLNVLTTVSQARGERVLAQVLGGRSLVVASNDEQTLKRVRELVGELDRPRDGAAANEVCEAVPLKHAYAKTVARDLLGLTLRGQPPTRIVADERANTVWIAGPKEQVAWFVEIALRMDENASTAGLTADEVKRELRFYKLARAQVVPLASTLSQLADALDLEVTLVPDAASDTLIAYATPSQHEHLETIIAKLDVLPKQAHKRAPATPRKKTRG